MTMCHDVMSSPKSNLRLLLFCIFAKTQGYVSMLFNSNCFIFMRFCHKGRLVSLIGITFAVYITKV